MVNLSYDPFQSQGASSGTANVPAGQSTGNQYQGADIADNLLFPFGQGISGSNNPVTLYAVVQFASGIGSSIGSFSGGTGPSGALVLFPGSGSILFSVGGQGSASGAGPVGSSGGGSGSVMVAASGFTPQGTAFASTSGIFGPAGCLFIQVPTSGNPVVKIPFFNS